MRGHPALLKFTLLLVIVMLIALQTAKNAQSNTHNQQLLDWQIETIDIKGGDVSTIALDSKQLPHIVYQSLGSSNHSLTYATIENEQWQYQTIDNQGETGWVVDSLVLDDNDNPHLAYGGAKYAVIQYAEFENNQWYREVVSLDDGLLAVSGASHTLDSSNNPHIIYCLQVFQDGSISVQYTRKVSEEWVVETISADDCWYDTAIELDSNDNPHVLYYEETTEDLKYGYFDGVAWHFDTIASNGRVGRPNELVLDQNDNPHVVYFSDTVGKFYYAYLKSGSWISEEIASGAGALHRFSLDIALDAFDRPYIGYVDPSLGSVFVAYKVGNSWQSEEVDTADNLGDMTVSAFSELHIVYAGIYDGNSTPQKYAVSTLPQPIFAYTLFLPMVIND